MGRELDRQSSMLLGFDIGKFNFGMGTASGLGQVAFHPIVTIKGLASAGGRGIKYLWNNPSQRQVVTDLVNAGSGYINNKMAHIEQVRSTRGENAALTETVAMWTEGWLNGASLISPGAFVKGSSVAAKVSRADELAGFARVPVAAESAALRSEAASNIWSGRRILAETRPDLSIAERNGIIRAFDLPSFRVETLTGRASEFRYFDGLPNGAGLPGRWSTSQWIASPSDRIRLLALPNNQATRAATVTLQPGTTVFRGTVAPQLQYGPNLTGGALQTYSAAGPRAVFGEIP
jgi:hypothetical protein